MKATDIKHCEMCHREQPLTFHHLIPKTNHKNKWFRKNFTLEDMRTRGIFICRKCHSHIHKMINEKELGRNYNTLELLLADERIRKFIQWVKKQS